MNELRRNILKSAGATGVVALAVTAGLLKSGNALAAWNSNAFAAKSVPEALKDLGLSNPADSKSITIKAPDIAENGAVVPVEVTSSLPDTTNIIILSEKNPTVLITDFKLSNGAEGFVSTRIKMAKTSMIRAVVTAGGKNYTAAKEVKVTIGGCGG
jgi:sulfur-oxidizing protein SoxY